MNKRKLNYRFHNPNPADVTADFLLKMLIEANAGKVEQAIQEAAKLNYVHIEKKNSNERCVK